MVFERSVESYEPFIATFADVRQVRRYVKGRDIYDLIWYLSDRTWPEPNIELLNNALRQTNWDGPEVTLANWRELVRQRVETIPLEAGG